MDLSIISVLLCKLLSENKSVTVPNMGCFVLEENSSELQFAGKIISPPERKILFCTSEFEDDGVLVAAYAEKMGISANEARDAVFALLKFVGEELNTSGKVTLPSLGVISMGGGDTLYFHASGDCALSGSFPFEPISVMPIDKSALEEIVEEEKREDVTEESEEVVEETEKVLVEAEDVTEKTEEVVEETEKVVVEGEDVTEKTEEVVKETEKVVVKGEDVTEESEEEIAGGVVEEKIEENIEKKIVEESEEIKEVSADIMVAVEERIVEEEGGKNGVKGEQSLKNRSKILWIVLVTIMLLIILLLALVYIFREELRPTLEQFLYTQEDINILKRAGEL